MNETTGSKNEMGQNEPSNAHVPKGLGWGGVRVVITGASSGLGLGLARWFEGRGARVVGVARGRERLEEVFEGSGVHALVADVSSKDDIHRIVAESVAVLGGVDVLIHCASSLGVVPLRPLVDTDCEAVEEALATNVLGPFRLTKAFLGSMLLQGGGHVVVLSSDAAENAYPTWGPYGVSKAAADFMARVWDAELGERGVHFAALDPGDMATPMHFAALPDADPASLRRPEDVAHELGSFLGQWRSRDLQSVRLGASAWRGWEWS